MAAYVIGVPSVTKTLTIHKPGREEETLMVDIRVRSLEEQEALQEKQNKAFAAKLAKEKKLREEGKPVPAEKNTNAHIREDILGMSGIADPNGNDVTVTPELIDSIWQDPFAYTAIIKAWGEVQRGVQESTAKN
jgi:hypothetical protein